MPPPTDQENSLPVDHSHTLLTAFSSFLTISIHNIIYYRHIYPQETFLSKKAFNLPVHQSRHPKVCAWITDAVTQVLAQLATGSVSTVAVVIHSPFVTAPRPFRQPKTNPYTSSPTSSLSISNSPPPTQIPGGSVLERYVFDVSRLPRWPSTRTHTTPADSMHIHGSRVMAKDFKMEKARGNYLDSDSINYVDVDEQFRGCLRRMAHAMEAMAPLPEGCGFTVAVELKKDGEAPIGHPQEWIPSQPSLQPSGSASSSQGQDLGGVNTTAVRSIEAGPLFVECWVEEGEAREAFMKAHQESQEDTVLRSERW
ncbi:DNA-binding protein [Cladorrhinum sp. PSN332]|nr:DNA-binding protein [Cladorrhinum sp. PSN332]